MFQDLFNRIRRQSGVQLTDQGKVYLYYGCVHAINYTFSLAKEKKMELTLESTTGLLEQEILDLKEYNIDVFSIPERAELYPLILVMARYFNISIADKAQAHLSKIITSAATAILEYAVQIVLTEKRAIMYATPMEIYDACMRIFKNKPWFVC